MLGGDWTDGTMTDFKWRHFQGDVILWAVRWYCRYPISYRDLEEMLAERGISVDHPTFYRWVQCYAPEMEKRLDRKSTRLNSSHSCATRSPSYDCKKKQHSHQLPTPPHYCTHPLYT